MLEENLVHHAHDHIENFQDTFTLLKPHLLCLNLNGMASNPINKQNKILPIGAGAHESAMIRAIIESGYDGPIGILGHIATQDVEISLRNNLTGLSKIFNQSGTPQ